MVKERIAKIGQPLEEETYQAPAYKETTKPIKEGIKNARKNIKSTARNIRDTISSLFSTDEASAATFIVDQEGFILEAKNIGDGKITSGIGLTDTGRKIGDKVTEEQAIQELKERLDKVERPALKKIEKVIPFKLTTNQRTVLLSLMFNIGVKAFHTSDAMKNLKANDIAGFKREAFSRKEGWVETAGKFSKGLFNRRQRELKLWDK